MQRLQLVRVHAVVLSNITVLRESYGLDLDGADVCYCCEVVRDILDRVIANLDLVRVIVSPDCEPYMRLNATAVAYMVTTTRHQLFLAQAVTFAIAQLLKADAKDSYEANLRVRNVSMTLRHICSRV